MSVCAGRGAMLKCPNCGKGKLFRAYLKQVDACSECGEEYGHIRADDGPAWLTILIVGHIVGTLLYTFWQSINWPDWAQIMLWCGLGLAMTLALLPSCKGVFIALLWRSGAPGSERDS